ncbi:MAG: sigma-70 family RNA polymerase sigma factor [Firmicutes bacterium]|nr:sigma-70 family RNA polymerase sigma factor [Bacillota bacterium]
MMTPAEQEKLYTEYRGKVLGYIRSRINNRDDAEDLCEDVFVKVFAAGDRYDSEKASPGTWIYAITRNAVIDYFRKSRPSEELPEDLSSDELPEDGVLKREMLEELAAALEGLPPDLTDIIVMRYYDRMPLTDIAEKLSLSYGAVKLRHQKALDMLRRVMDPGKGRMLHLV